MDGTVSGWPVLKIEVTIKLFRLNMAALTDLKSQWSNNDYNKKSYLCIQLFMSISKQHVEISRL